MSFNTTRWALNRRNGTFTIFVEILVSLQTKFSEEKKKHIRSFHCNSKLRKIPACLCPITNFTLFSTHVLKSAIHVPTPATLLSLICSSGCSSKTEKTTWLPLSRIPELKSGSMTQRAARACKPGWEPLGFLGFCVESSCRDGKGAWGNRAKWLPFSAINPITLHGF